LMRGGRLNGRDGKRNRGDGSLVLDIVQALSMLCRDGSELPQKEDREVVQVSEQAVSRWV